MESVPFTLSNKDHAEKQKSLLQFCREIKEVQYICGKVIVVIVRCCGVSIR